MSVLTDHRLVDLWREYSARQYRGGWIEATREEVYRFITWSNHHPRLGKEILLAQRARTLNRHGIRVREHKLRSVGGQPLIELRMQA